jgi:hypothetical protein
MKFKPLKTISNVKTLKVLKNELLYKTNDGQIFWKDIQLFDMQFQSIQYKGNRLFF